MAVYGEYLFLENFITGIVILSLTQKICNRKKSIVRLMMGSLLCGIYSFVLFIPINWALALVGKLGFSLLVTLTAFGYGTRRMFGKTVGVFYIVSFLMGGLTIALMYATKIPGLAGNGSVYLHGIAYLQIAAGVLLTYLLGNWLVGFIKGKLQKEKVFTDLSVKIEEQHWEMRAFVDTGNFLREPISGNPAVVLSAACGKRILRDLLKTDAVDGCCWPDHLARRQCIVPFRSVGQRGVMQGIRADHITVEGRVIEKIVLAISNEEFACWRGEETYEVLLQQQIIEEGALRHAR